MRGKKLIELQKNGAFQSLWNSGGVKMTKRNFQDGQVASAQAMPNILPLEAIPAAMHAPLKICTRPHAASCAHQTAHPKRARQHPHPHSKT
jgi:hypothetical protein